MGKHSCTSFPGSYKQGKDSSVTKTLNQDPRNLGSVTDFAIDFLSNLGKLPQFVFFIFKMGELYASFLLYVVYLFSCPLSIANT